MAPWEINGPLGNKWPSWEISGTVLGNKRQEINGPHNSWEITGWEITGGDPGFRMLRDIHIKAGTHI